MKFLGFFLAFVALVCSCKNRQVGSNLSGTDENFYNMTVVDLQPGCAIYTSQFHRYLKAKYGGHFNEASLKSGWKSFVASSKAERTEEKFLLKANGNTISEQWGKLFLVLDCLDNESKFAFVFKQTKNQVLSLSANIKPTKKAYPIDDYTRCVEFVDSSTWSRGTRVSDCLNPGMICKSKKVQEGRCTKYNPDPQKFTDGQTKPCRCVSI